mmetsp:Transcript_38049/g.91791  ORF Transcript_38049/g.91791 Transcript_38049/m.91791 type:complete len:118 (-) Transcript_38049:426-779(-)
MLRPRLRERSRLGLLRFDNLPRDNERVVENDSLRVGVDELARLPGSALVVSSDSPLRRGAAELRFEAGRVDELARRPHCAPTLSVSSTDRWLDRELDLLRLVDERDDFEERFLESRR